MGRRWSLFALAALPTLLLPALLSTTAIAQAAIPRCTGSPQVCDKYLQSQTTLGTQLWLGTSGGNAILFTADGAATQRWDIYPITGSSDFIIYNASTNNVLTRGAGGCFTSIMYCVYVEAQVGSGSGTEQAQKWLEVQTNPDIFESEGSGDRCLDNFNGNESAGQQAILFPCNTGDDAQEWSVKASQ
jgi:hypothetical protein